MTEIWPNLVAPKPARQDDTEPPTAFETKRVRLRRCYDHIAVGGNAVLTQIFGQDLPAEFIRDKWENIVWCESCRQWVALKPGCVTAHN